MPLPVVLAPPYLSLPRPILPPGGHHNLITTTNYPNCVASNDSLRLQATNLSSVVYLFSSLPVLVSFYRHQVDYPYYRCSNELLPVTGLTLTCTMLDYQIHTRWWR